MCGCSRAARAALAAGASPPCRLRGRPFLPLLPLFVLNAPAPPLCRIVFQEGGGWCWNAATCAGRSKSLTGSGSWSTTKSAIAGSLLASADAAFSGASFAYLPYCSSDGWAGSRASAPPTNFEFRGRDIVTAAFTELVNARGLGSTPGTRVLYGGCSAGARGALFNLDRVATALLPALVQPPSNLARVGGLLDSAFWVDIAPLAPSATPFADQARDVVALANASSADQAACTAAYPDPADSWKCIFGQYAVPFIKSDFFLHAYQYDLFQLSSDTKVPVPDKTPQQRAYCETFRNATRADFAADVVKPNGPGKNAGLLPACYKHCNTEGSTFSTLATTGVTLQDAVAAWWGAAGAGAAAVPQYIVEDCAGFNCGTDCPKV